MRGLNLYLWYDFAWVDELLTKFVVVNWFDRFGDILFEVSIEL